MRAKVDPYSVKCPVCEQGYQRDCIALGRDRMFNGFRKHPHPQRHRLARERSKAKEAREMAADEPRKVP